MSSTKRDEEPIELSTLAPREEWTRGLPAVGHEAARRAQAQLGERLSLAARWFLPIAAVSAAACWFVGVRAGGAEAHDATETTTVLGVGSDAELVRVLTLPGGGAR